MKLLFSAILQPRAAFTIAKRFRGKINIQRPRAPHFERQLLVDLAKPVHAPPKWTLPEIVICEKEKTSSRKEIDNPFERILARECLNWFNTSKMVVFIHLNSISMEEKTPIFATLAKNNMHLRCYGKKIISMATKETRYEAVNHLFISHQNIIFGQPENAAKLFKILKKTPQLVVMGKI